VGINQNENFKELKATAFLLKTVGKMDKIQLGYFLYLFFPHLTFGHPKVKRANLVVCESFCRTGQTLSLFQPFTFYEIVWCEF